MTKVFRTDTVGGGSERRERDRRRSVGPTEKNLVSHESHGSVGCPFVVLR